MNFCNQLKKKLDKLYLLKHPFYKEWNMGTLSTKTLQTYAKEYYHHVAAFPRYITGIHTLCGDIKSRQVLLDNLIDEEKGEENHPELWKRFAEGIGLDRSELDKSHNLKQTKELIEGFFRLVKNDYATGLGALYAYERQTPEVAKSKIEGLKKNYNINDARTLQFFEVHAHADIWHTEELEALIKNLNNQDQLKVEKGARAGAKLLWSFLDGMMEEHKACAS